MDFNIEDFGAVGDDDKGKSRANTVAVNNCTVRAIAEGGSVYVPRRKGFWIDNGNWFVPGPHLKIRGDGSMGASYNGMASRIKGTGKGHTLWIGAGGCTVDGLSFYNDGAQKGNDASLFFTESQCYARNLYLESPNNGIAVSFDAAANGETWLSDILMGGLIRTSVCNLNAGNSAVHIRHLLAFHQDDNQPPYGVVATSLGALTMNACDIDNCGTNLAIVPGLGGVKGQWCNAIEISDSYFDNGNGPGNVYVGPQADGWASMMSFTNVWTSTVNNGEGNWNTNGFTFDGSMSRPVALGVLPVEDITLVNCRGRSMRNHCGVYARNVNGLCVANSTFGGGNFVGVQVGPNCSDYQILGNKLGAYTPPSVGGFTRGNDAYGLIVERNGFGIIQGNMARGNGRGGLWNIGPSPFQQISGNVW